MTQPQWFYSSLAQVTAAIVGFIGGFLLLRLLEVMREWSTLRNKLQQRQERWLRTEHEERQFDQIEPPKLGPFKGERLRLSNEESAAWTELYQTIQERAAARMPRELLFSLGVVTLLAIVFALGPLLALDDPSLTARLVWLVILAVLLAVVAASIAFALYRTHQHLQSYELYPHTQGRLEDYELWIEGIQEQERENKRAKEDQTSG